MVSDFFKIGIVILKRWSSVTLYFFGEIFVSCASLHLSEVFSEEVPTRYLFFV